MKHIAALHRERIQPARLTVAQSQGNPSTRKLAHRLPDKRRLIESDYTTFSNPFNVATSPTCHFVFTINSCRMPLKNKTKKKAINATHV